MDNQAQLSQAPHDIDGEYLTDEDKMIWFEVWQKWKNKGCMACSAVINADDAVRYSWKKESE